MTRHIERPPADFQTPPGTVCVIRDDGAIEETEFVLQPLPSDDPNDPLVIDPQLEPQSKAYELRSDPCPHSHHLHPPPDSPSPRTSLPLVFWVLWISEFGWNYGQLNTASALNYVGTALGCILFIPPAVKYGRRSMYILSSLVILATAAWSATLNTLPELYISQLIFGLASATNETIVEMTQLADLYFVHQRGTANGLYMVMVTIGSFLSSIVAGYMAANGNWRLCYWVTFAVEAALLVYFCLFFEESKYIPRIEAQALSALSERPSSVAKKDTSSASETAEPGTTITPQGTNTPHHINPDIPLLTWRQRMRLITKTDESMWEILWTTVLILFRFPAVMYTALTYAFCLCWISAQATLTSIVFTQPPYNFGTVGVGNMSLGVFIGCILGSIWGALSDRTVFWFARKNYGYYEPEMRLHLNHFPAACVGGGLIMFGVTAAKGMHWIWPSVGSTIFGFGLNGISDVALCVLIDSYQAVTGEAFIGVAFIRNCFSIAISFALVPWMDAQGTQNMSIVMGVWATAVAFIHVPLLIWGKRIRVKTAGAYELMAKERALSRL
ncbi:major facilitator superfamily domain-containing protein, partial [Dactylonectria macrodidyma]